MYAGRADNAASPLTTPTYDGSGYAVHPSVYDAGEGNTWNGYRYWMAMTPYPGGDSQYENPSILASADGQTWVVPDGLTNPIVAKPSQPIADYNSDPDLIMVSNVLHVIYRAGNQTANQDLIYDLSSSDGVTWSASTEIFTGSYAAEASPSPIWDGNQFVMFTVETNTKTVRRRTCATLAGTWSDPEAVRMSIAARDIWHIDVLLDGSTYFALIYTVQGDLWLGRSSDGLTWQTSFEPVMVKSAAGWDQTQLYRSGFSRTTTGFDIWYSGFLGNNPRIGFTQLVYLP